MFSGIIQAICSITDIKHATGLATITLALPSSLISDLKIGASIALDGVCLTVTTINELQVSFDVIAETLAVTTLGELVIGNKVNVERSLKMGDEIGGHLLSGHIHGCSEIVDIVQPEINFILTIKLAKPQIQSCFAKGYIALNGASLTIVDVNKQQQTISVHLIPETLRMTTFAEKHIGDTINFEVDQQTIAIVNAVKEITASLSS